MFIRVNGSLHPTELLKRVKISNPHIEVNPNICSLCQICEAVCAEAKEGRSDRKKARIRMITEGGRPEAKVCQNCDHPACVGACPTGALRADRWRITMVNEKSCTGCGLCAEACPHGAINIVAVNNNRKVARLCDLCGECVANCPYEALRIEGVFMLT